MWVSHGLPNSSLHKPWIKSILGKQKPKETDIEIQYSVLEKYYEHSQSEWNLPYDWSTIKAQFFTGCLHIDH